MEWDAVKDKYSSTCPLSSASQPAFLPNCLPYWPTTTSGQPWDSSLAQSLPGDFSLILQPISFQNLTSLALPQFWKVWSQSRVVQKKDHSQRFRSACTLMDVCLLRKRMGNRVTDEPEKRDSRSVLVNYCSQANTHSGTLAESKSTHPIPKSHQKSSHFLRLW